jgi:carbamoyl-phosphate synthase large subunit
LPADPVFPLFIKPRFGRGSVGAFAVRTPRELAFFRDYVPQPVVQSFLDGPEFTIDVLCDFEGQALSVVPRERVVIRAGVVDRGRTVADPALIELGLACTRAMPFVGAINLQCRMVRCGAESSVVPVIFEINPRFSGGIPLTIAAGADFPSMLIELVLDRPVEPAIGKFREHVWMTSYETSMFMDENYIGFSAAPRRPNLEVA